MTDDGARGRGGSPAVERASRGIRLAELVGSLSLATDLATGQPLEHGLRRSLLAVWIGQDLGLPPDDLSDVFYVSLLGSVGCTLEASVLARLARDDIAVSGRIATVDVSNLVEVATFGLRNFGAGERPLRRVGKVVAGALAGPAAFQAVCRDTAIQVGEMLDLGTSINEALAQCHERWNGRGGPRQLKGADIHVAARVFHVAHDAEVFERLGGAGAGVAIVRRREGNQYDPDIAHRFGQIGAGLFERLDRAPTWDALLIEEPPPIRWIAGEELDSLGEAIGRFVDLRSPFTLGHSTGVARLAESGARTLGLSENDATSIRRAGYLHDLGRMGVPIAVWNATDGWSGSDRERAMRHPSLTELVLARSTSLGPLGTLAGLHHERLDGSGYRAVPGSFQPVAAQVLAAADLYATKTEPRPHRPAFSGTAAVEVLRQEARAGRLEPELVAAIAAAAGHLPRHLQPPSLPAGISERELEVLRLLVRGLTNREMAATLFISPKTVDHHVQHIYDKTGVSTRVGATLFALRHGLVSDE
jgi:HD-GYP domain-containing protein (c-di-GMP phosphodiesterase class II)